MMFMNTFVHILEGATALLVLLLLFQVARYYRAYTPSSLSDESPSINPQSVSRPSVRPQPIGSSKPAVVEPAVSGSSEAILNDYIGGFFADASNISTDLQAYKAPVSPLFVQKKSVDLEVEELEEDSIITVMSSASNEAGSDSEKVMTDKVVHAMLDEAKLVCAS